MIEFWFGGRREAFVTLGVLDEVGIYRKGEDIELFDGLAIIKALRYFRAYTKNGEHRLRAEIVVEIN